ncbi:MULTISPECIES: cytochrome P450 [Streptomyces]|uniref:cytochrome P450 n=1 Tax=Streptomyces TaxID=1883 RepID=UPI0006AF651A|nr:MULTISPECIES: cytochrome P450 [unclassified Streptomyces]KOU64287.1 cytochrome P450 [Streptomyces sp. IGB124]KOV15554.1 cytochrome P450 [Streptomyces sp. XY413]KOV28193.1 cytochrome P450 [Streptomyces sp. H021]
MKHRSAGPLGPLPEFLGQYVAGEGQVPDGIDVVPFFTPAGDRMWLVCDYALARRVLTDRRFSRAEAVTPQAPKLNDAQPVPNSMMSMDGADHSRLRRVVTRAFTTGRTAAMAPAVEELADRHLDALAASGPGTDLIEALVAPLPLAVLCSLLGVPPEDSTRFRDWVEVLFDISASTPQEKARRRLELIDYMADLIDRKRRRPEDDLLTSMIAAHEQGDLSMGELLTMGLTLLMAGYETVVGQLGLSAHALLRDPAAYRELCGRPDRLAPTVEELLRLTPSTPISFPRVAVEPVPLGSVTVQAGEGVIVSLLHGNRDGKTFAEPGLLDPQGHDAAHLTFGHGVHRCLGAPLARLQLQTVLERLMRRFPTLRLAAGPDAVVWKDGLGTRGLARLLVDW